MCIASWSWVRTFWREQRNIISESEHVTKEQERMGGNSSWLPNVLLLCRKIPLLLLPRPPSHDDSLNDDVRAVGCVPPPLSASLLCSHQGLVVVEHCEKKPIKIENLIREQERAMGGNSSLLLNVLLQKVVCPSKVVMTIL